MRPTKVQLAADIRRLFDTLAPYGIRRPSQLAALLRDPHGDDPTWPSDAYIRLMLGDKGPEPSERFGARFYALADHVYAALAQGADLTALVTDATGKPDTYDPAAAIRFVPVPANADLHAGLFVLSASAPAHLAVIPAEVLGHCAYDACGRPFYKRVPWQTHCCPLCAGRHARARRAERTATDPLAQAS